MTRKEAERLAKQSAVLQSLGFTSEEAEQLRRISMTLRRWFEMECNGDVERDEESGRPYWRRNHHEDRPTWRIADRETGAKKRLAKILSQATARRAGEAEKNAAYKDFALTAYIQTDPRGAALYIIRPGDVPPGEDVHAYYSRGICVY